MQPDVVIFIEHVARELSLACVMKVMAREQYGLEVAISSLVRPVRELPKAWQPGLVCVPYFYSSNDFGVRHVLRRFPNASVLNLAFEQLLSKANAEFKKPRDAFGREQVLHAASGPQFAEYLRSHGVNARHVVQSGSLACQLYQEPYRRRFENCRTVLAERHGLDPNKRWVLFPENFAAAFFSRSQQQQRIRTGFSASDLQAYIDFSRHCFRETMQWIAEAAHDCDDVEFIVRPRPAMSESVFREHIAEVVGSTADHPINIIKEGDVRNWILSADAVISTISSTLVEAASAGIPTAMLSPCPIPASVQTDWNRHAHCIREQDDLLEFCQAAKLDGKSSEQSPSHELTRWCREQLLASDDAIENVVTLMSEVKTGKMSVPRSSTPTIVRLARSMKELLRTIEITSRRWLRKGKRSCFSHEQDELTPDMIHDEVSRWKQSLSDGESTSGQAA